MAGFSSSMFNCFGEEQAPTHHWLHRLTCGSRKFQVAEKSKRKVDAVEDPKIRQNDGERRGTPPKFNSSPLKNGGWKTTFLLGR